MATVSGTFTAVGQSATLDVPSLGEDITISLSGGATATVRVERERVPYSGSWHTIRTYYGNVDASFRQERKNERYRFNCVDYTSGTVTYSISDGVLTEQFLGDAIEITEDGVVINGTLQVSGATTLTGAATLSAASTIATGTTVGNLTLADGSITDSGGSISFGNETLTTTGTLSSGAHTTSAVPITTANLGAKNGATVAVVENGDGIFHQSVFTCTATPITMADEAATGQYGGVKIYDFPAGQIVTLGATIDGDFTAVEPWLDTWTGDIALGTAVSTDASGSAADDNIQQLTATGTASTLVAAIDASVQVATALTESGARWFNGTDTAIDMYLNVITDDDDGNTATTDAMLFTGTITLHWLYLGTIAA